MMSDDKYFVYPKDVDKFGFDWASSRSPWRPK